MSTNSQILAEIDAFIFDSGIAESTFGLRAVNDGKFVRRLRGGGRLYRETEERVRDYIKNNRTACRPAEEARS